MSFQSPEESSASIVPESEMLPTDRSDVLKEETHALIEAMKRRAQSELEAARDLTRETYLNTVRQMREALEQNQLIERDRIEESMRQFQNDAETHWNSVVGDIESFGKRLQDAAKVAWETLTHPEDKPNDDSH